MGFHKWGAWIAETLVLWALLYAVQIPLRRKALPVLRTIVFLAKIIFIPGVALLFAAIEWKAAYVHGDWLTAAYIALVGDTAASAAEYVVRRLRRKKRGKPHAVSCCAAYSVRSSPFPFSFTGVGTRPGSP